MTFENRSSRQPRLSDAQRLAWLRLIRSENVGPATFRSLVNHFGSAQAALDALPDLARRGGARRIRIASQSEALAELAAAEKAGVTLIALGEPGYPPALQAVDAPPPLLAVRGAPAVLERPAIAIVGARNASTAGRLMAERIARGCGEAGVVIVSGLARGIDAAAHNAALATGTVAVLAGGLDRIYPPEHEGLLADIVARGGAAISEMPMGWTARAHDFPRRNRIISGCSLAVVVVEAARRSGSLHTARFAGEQGRVVLAVPGSPLDPRAEGCNDLIRDGAILARNAADVLEAASPMAGDHVPAGPVNEDAAPAPLPPVADDSRAVVIAALGPTPTAVDALVRHTGLPQAIVMVILLELEVAGRLERHGGNRVSLIPQA